jgi:LacI family transcriptional regulator
MSTQQQRRPTMRDVAELAGVSFKTVSRVINDEGGVSGDLAVRVRQAVEVLGYRRDDRARRLRQGDSRTGTIGFVLVDVANPFFSAILRGIEEVARSEDYLVFAGSSDGVEERENQLVEAFVARRVDGLIIVSSGPGTGSLGHEVDRGTPVVFLDLEPERLGGDLVRSDHRGGAALATRHLQKYGHRDIAFFGDDASVFSAGLRGEGFRDAIREAGLDVDEGRIVHGRHTSEVWRSLIAEYLGRTDPPTALFTAQNFVTIGATQALHDLELHETIALVGFDDIELADVVRPGISVVPQHPRDLGKRAAELLFARIAGSPAPFIRDIVPASVIERGSGEIPSHR